MTAKALETYSSQAGAAPRHSDDAENQFHKLWLDRSLTDSCALWSGDDDTLEHAQERKLSFHLDAIEANRIDSVLDIGCGWGSLLSALNEHYEISKAVGLTLSEAQAKHIRARSRQNVEVRTGSWRQLQLNTRFDAIVAIGALEQFPQPAESASSRILMYREFFSRCRSWLNENGVLSLETAAYPDGCRDCDSYALHRELYPKADFPTLAELSAAAGGLFEVQAVYNARIDYARTCEEWARRLRVRRNDAVRLVGENVVERYERYLALTALGCRLSKLSLLRVILRPLVKNWL
ncbi:cyclopropane-fatty-acyl-phospholipid synthase [Alkalilimnicola ehrlichii]|uniref:Cyclopropane-fatty-acyl-phospholipid synthase n=2 Tax=Alkalilimnicola ehrlichii TaxID=351052 RepID=A0A3E0WR49_9GAMM|nr:class I SAM-dependent methyltransferase [Alkalilimnicola ehrlichii]RFA27246.1 cyclopropane-fatty-acyl-phospholipid synthase [Alkalilimnicola ehrlichii]RFA35442.1 cyclopropane-fatty-acyl-phospholipid synthase [Alkalilimnicola ehrlichii]